MENEWKAANFRIVQFDARNGEFVSTEVSGETRNGFGIHENEYGWSITHLHSGWAAFVAIHPEGARLIARRLSENHAADFDKLKTNGAKVENYHPLASKVAADQDLWRLRNIFCITKRELKQMGAERQPDVEIVS